MRSSATSSKTTQLNRERIVAGEGDFVNVEHDRDGRFGETLQPVGGQGGIEAIPSLLKATINQRARLGPINALVTYDAPRRPPRAGESSSNAKVSYDPPKLGAFRLEYCAMCGPPGAVERTAQYGANIADGGGYRFRRPLKVRTPAGLVPFRRSSGGIRNRDPCMRS